MRSALLFAAIAWLAVACGAQAGREAASAPRTSTDAQNTTSRSARFFEVTSYLVEGEREIDVIEGAFDWGERQGWAVQRYANDEVWSKSVDGTCYQRSTGEDWDPMPGDPEGVCGLAAMQQDPTKTFALIRRLAGVEQIGVEEIDGVKTTRYRATWDDPGKGPLELWVDDAEVVRQARYGGPDSQTTTQYLDFGVEVDVEQPTTWHPADTVTEP